MPIHRPPGQPCWLQLKDKVRDMPEWKRQAAARRILSYVSEAYGTMILGEGLFQADGHPGNILVRPGGGIALLDYGQSKQLTAEHRVAFAKVIQALNRWAGSGCIDHYCLLLCTQQPNHAFVCLTWGYKTLP